MPITMPEVELADLLRHVAHFTSQATAQRLSTEHTHQEIRRLQLAEENMRLMADLSTARTTIANQQAAVAQCHRDAVGHNHCWRNWDRLFEAFGLEPVKKELPPRDEAEAGCKAFWDELYSCSHRWPDFINIGDE